MEKELVLSYVINDDPLALLTRPLVVHIPNLKDFDPSPRGNSEYGAITVRVARRLVQAARVSEHLWIGAIFQCSASGYEGTADKPVAYPS